MRSACLCVALLVLGLGAKKPAAPAPEAAPPEPALTVKVPDTAAARSFAKALVKTEVKGWAPIGGSSGRLVYTTLDFAPDGTWAAVGKLSVDGDDIDCKESGTWQVDDAMTDTSANIEWLIQKTTCPSRDADVTVHAKVTLAKDGPGIELH